MDIWNCEYYVRCKNNTKCKICGPSQRLLKLPGDDTKKKAIQKAERHVKGSNKEDSWKELEQYVADQLNAIPYTPQARRQLRSGGIWFLPGDVDDTILIPECKEREEYTSKGEKSFAIKKDWIEKVYDEARLVDKFPAVIFRFKNDDKAYFIDDFEVLRDMVHLIKILNEDVVQLTKELDLYKQLALKYKRMAEEKERERVMPIIYEEFIRCENCGCPDFKEEAIFTFHKLVKSRDSKKFELEPREKEYRYVCKECNHELNR